MECNQALVGMQVTAGYISVDSFLHGTVEKLARRGGDFLVWDVKPFLFSEGGSGYAGQSASGTVHILINPDRMVSSGRSCVVSLSLPEMQVVSLQFLCRKSFFLYLCS